MSEALHNKLSGFTLMEVMVALLISAISLLGLAALQGTARTHIEITRQYTAANQLAQELIENMRANPVGMRDGHYNNINTAQPPTGVSGDFCSAGCTPANIATIDSLRWSESISNTEVLRQGTGITMVDAGRIIVTIMWSGDLQRVKEPKGKTSLDCSVLECLIQEVPIP
ncbi:MAG: type IV pilus modification protein PilV [Gammaproteobacteria bacterium]|nr:type IV pilus modification protein PilV [Gammaproteobacteria bacterium]